MDRVKAARPHAPRERFVETSARTSPPYARSGIRTATLNRESPVDARRRVQPVIDAFRRRWATMRSAIENTSIRLLRQHRPMEPWRRGAALHYLHGSRRHTPDGAGIPPRPDPAAVGRSRRPESRGAYREGDRSASKRVGSWGATGSELRSRKVVRERSSCRMPRCDRWGPGGSVEVLVRV